MKLKKIITAAMLSFLLWLPLYSSNKIFPHFLNTYIPKKDTTLLVVFHPTMYVLESIDALKQAGFIPDNMYVVGVFHTLEKSDYDTPQKFAKHYKKRWIFFHAEDGALTPKNIYTRNKCSDLFKTIVKKADGAILFGGADIPPYLYREKTSLLTRISTPYRHFIELSFVFNLLGGCQDTSAYPLLENKPDFPLLGICLGEQTLNVGTGGTLIQDIWSEIYNTNSAEDVITLDKEKYHRNPWSIIYPEKDLLHYSMHHVILETGKILADKISAYIGQEPLVISSHHQAVNTLGKNFEIAAYSMDKKVIEAIANNKFPNVLGIQFHPEFSDIWTNHSKIQFAPVGKKASISSILKNDDRSMEFHKNIWNWFFTAVGKEHKSLFVE